MKIRQEHGQKFVDETRGRQIRFWIAMSAFVPTILNFFVANIWWNAATLILAFSVPVHTYYRRFRCRWIRRQVAKERFTVIVVPAEREVSQLVAMLFEPPNVQFRMIEPLRGWFREGCSGNYGVVPEKIDSANANWAQARRFYFSDPNDAFAFKMRWL